MAVHIVFSLILLGLIGVYVYDFVQRYRASTSITLKGKLIDAFHGSATISVARVTALLASLCDVGADDRRYIRSYGRIKLHPRNHPDRSRAVLHGRDIRAHGAARRRTL